MFLRRGARIRVDCYGRHSLAFGPIEEYKENFKPMNSYQHDDTSVRTSLRHSQLSIFFSLFEHEILQSFYFHRTKVGDFHFSTRQEYEERVCTTVSSVELLVSENWRFLSTSILFLFCDSLSCTPTDLPESMLETFFLLIL